MLHDLSNRRIYTPTFVFYYMSEASAVCRDDVGDVARIICKTLLKRSQGDRICECAGKYHPQDQLK